MLNQHIRKENEQLTLFQTLDDNLKGTVPQIVLETLAVEMSAFSQIEK